MSNRGGGEERRHGNEKKKMNKNIYGPTHFASGWEK